MLEDDLCATSPNKHHREIVELPDLALQPYAIDQKHRHIKFVVAEMLEEQVLDGPGTFCVHVCTPFRASFGCCSLHNSSSGIVSAANKWLTGNFGAAILT
jgi:hypothetical protein